MPWEVLSQIFTFTLTGVDIVSDIILAIDYCVVDTLWCGLTWAFIVGPVLTFCIILLFYRLQKPEKSRLDWSSIYMDWKATEVCLEAGPQLVLQLYIIAFTAKDSSSTQESSLFANIVRVFTIVTSLLSLSFGFVTWRDFQETEETKKDYKWDWKDMTADMVWNVFAISARVITLALFAAYQPNWFWGLLGGQILVVFLCLGSYANKKMEDEKRDFLYHAFMSSFTAVGMVFNMFLAYSISVPFPVYLFYWLVMFIENTVMITLWYQWSSNLGLWYRDVAISCTVIAYIVSLIIKTVHCYFYNRKRGDDIKNKMFRWNFFYYTHKPNKNQDMTPKE